MRKMGGIAVGSGPVDNSPLRHGVGVVVVATIPGLHNSSFVSLVP
jgi:hypothetical protein